MATKGTVKHAVFVPTEGERRGESIHVGAIIDAAIESTDLFNDESTSRVLCVTEKGGVVFCCVKTNLITGEKTKWIEYIGNVEKMAKIPEWLASKTQK